MKPWYGNGTPPVGTVCDYVIGEDAYKVTVVAYYNDEIVVEQHDAAPQYTGVQPGYLKPFNHKERERLVDMADQLTQKFDGSYKARDVFGILFDLGMLREPPGEKESEEEDRW